MRWHQRGREEFRGGRIEEQAPNLGLYRLVILAPYDADDRALGVLVSLCSPPFRRWSREGELSGPGECIDMAYDALDARV